MSDFTSRLVDVIQQPFKSGERFLRRTLKGDLSGAWEAVKDSPGDQNRANSRFLEPIFGENWVTSNPAEALAAVAGGVYGGNALLGKLGTGSGAASSTATATDTAATGGAANPVSNKLAGMFTKENLIRQGAKSLGATLMQQRQDTQAYQQQQMQQQMMMNNRNGQNNMMPATSSFAPTNVNLVNNMSTNPTGYATYVTPVGYSTTTNTAPNISTQRNLQKLGLV